jgi:outer membrane protein OmpA-like peptidoglycan-associated protein
MGARTHLMVFIAGVLLASTAPVPTMCLAQDNASPQLPPPAVDQEGCTDIKGLPRLAASVIASCDSGDSIEVTLPLKLDARGVLEEKSVRGDYEFREYRIPPVFQEGQAFQSLMQLFRNVQLTIKYSDNSSTITARYQDTWVLVTVGTDYYDVKAVRVPVTPWVPVRNAQEISREMQSHNRVAIYGIEFSQDNQTIVEDRSRILNEVLAYLNGNPGVAVEVESHLVSRNGTVESDQESTAKRAQAVVAWLEAHGIATSRLRPKAFGRSKPIAEENDTLQEIRRNERIELAKAAS